MYVHGLVRPVRGARRAANRRSPPRRLAADAAGRRAAKAFGLCAKFGFSGAFDEAHDKKKHDGADRGHDQSADQAPARGYA